MFQILAVVLKTLHTGQLNGIRPSKIGLFAYKRRIREGGKPKEVIVSDLNVAHTKWDLKNYPNWNKRPVTRKRNEGMTSLSNLPD